MNEGRNLNVEAIRGVSILVILFYHYHSIIVLPFPSYFWSGLEVLARLSLMAFFIISGYGTYFHFARHDRETTAEFMRKRLSVLLPPYYLVLVFTLLLSMNAGFLAKDKIRNLLFEFLMLDNLFPEMNFCNGAAWTVALFVQSYLLSKPLWKIVNHQNVIVQSLSILIPVSLRMIAICFLDRCGFSPAYRVAVTIRYPVFTLDLFAMGMFAAKYSGEKKSPRRELIPALSLTAVFIVSLSVIGDKYELGYGNDAVSLILRYGGAALTAFLIKAAGCVNSADTDNPLTRAVQFVAKNEYGIYLCHMPMIANLSYFSPIFIELKESRPALLLISMSMLAILIGNVIMRLCSSHEYKKLFSFQTGL